MSNNDYENFRIEALDRIERPDPNSVIESVRKQFMPYRAEDMS